MTEQFGVIAIKSDDKTLVVYDGIDKELFDILDIVKSFVSESAEVKLLDKAEYEQCKDNIVELNKLLT